MADIIDVKLGSNQVNKIFAGTDLVFEKVVDTTPPVTTVYPDPTNPDLTHNPGTKVWLEVDEMCTTYYTLDGTTPTTSSTIFTDAFILNETTTIKYFSVDVAGNVEAVKTTVFDIAAVTYPTTTISPSATVQNNIPITVTLTSSEVGATIKYIIGTGTEQTYTAPFTVNQSTTGVQSTNITIKYWSIGANGTEPQKTITYDTSGAVPAQATVTATAGNNQVVLDWNDTANSTAWTVYRSTTAGQLGAPIPSPTSEYLWQSTYTDTTALNGTTYYYTVRSQNYSANFTDSDPITATPTAPAAQNWRYLKLQGYGAAESGQETTTRLIEFQAWAGATNVAAQYSSISWDNPDNTTDPPLSSIVDGNFATTANTYPYWWTPTPNANVVIDLGSQKTLTKLNWFGYSIAGVQRTNRFKVLASNTNNGTDWVTIWDNSTGQAGVQPILPSGYEKTL